MLAEVTQFESVDWYSSCLWTYEHCPPRNALRLRSAPLGCFFYRVSPHSDADHRRCAPESLQLDTFPYRSLNSFSRSRYAISLQLG